MSYPFLFSPDQDRPGNKQYVTFNPNECYVLEGKTHGHLSHAIKHYEEFDAAGMKGILQNAMDYLKSIDKLFLMNMDGKVLFSGSDVHAKLTLNAVHNTFDLINDKFVNKVILTPEESHIHASFLLPLGERYQQLISAYLDNHILSQEQEEHELKNHFESGARLKFTGKYSGGEFTYILDASNSGLLVIQENKGICTLFRIDKQGNSLEEIRGYFTRQVELVDEGIRNFLSV
jgi:hypothetical protein